MDPVFLTIFGFDITWYGLSYAVGLFIALAIAKKRAELYGLDKEKLDDFVFKLMIGGLIGGRLFYVVRFWDDNFAGRSFWHVFNVREGGMVFQGGLIIGVLTMIWYTRRHKMDFFRSADLLAPSLALAHAFGRFGCLMAGCCYGGVCKSGPSIQFPQGSYAWQDHLNKGLIHQHDTHSLAVHPSQIYEMVFNIGLFALILCIAKRMKVKGQVLALYVGLYSFGRFGLEFLRGDQDLTAGMTAAQYIALGTGVLGLVAFFVLPRLFPNELAIVSAQNVENKEEKNV